MTIDDTFFELQAELQAIGSSTALKYFEEIETAFYVLEKDRDIFLFQRNTLWNAIKVAQYECMCEISEIHGAGTRFCHNCGGLTKQELPIEYTF